jgi:hypothetical protein
MMFWQNIADIKVWMTGLTERLERVENDIEKILGHIQELSEKNFINETLNDCMIDLRDTFSAEDEYSSINRIHDKLNTLMNDEKRIHSVELATKTLDKFDDYMKNVNKLNVMINEFKGCVSLARGALGERKELDKQHNVHYQTESKIDAIYQYICVNKEKKSPKKRKAPKKKAVSSSSAP